MSLEDYDTVVLSFTIVVVQLSRTSADSVGDIGGR